MCTHSFTPQHNLYYRFKCETVLDCTFFISFFYSALLCFALLCFVWQCGVHTHAHTYCLTALRVSFVFEFLSISLICFERQRRCYSSTRRRRWRKGKKTEWNKSRKAKQRKEEHAHDKCVLLLVVVVLLLVRWLSAPLYPLKRIVHITPYAITNIGWYLTRERDHSFARSFCSAQSISRFVTRYITTMLPMHIYMRSVLLAQSVRIQWIL